MLRRVITEMFEQAGWRLQEVLLRALLYRDLVSGGNGSPHDLDGAEVNLFYSVYNKCG